MNVLTAPFEIAGLTVTPIPIMHGSMPIVGYRFGDIAYLTDLKTIPDASRPLLQNLDVLVTTALRHTQHPAHQTLNEALAEIETIAPKRAYLTHISHDFGLYGEVEPTLPDHVRIARDGDIATSSWQVAT